MTSPRMMFGALALSTVALLAGCSRPLDPQANAPVVSPQPATALLQAAPDLPLTASTSVNTSNVNSAHGFDVQVKGVEACQNAAKEHTYRTNRDTMTSCIGSNGLAYARFACEAPSAKPIICRPF